MSRRKRAPVPVKPAPPFEPEDSEEAEEPRVHRSRRSTIEFVLGIVAVAVFCAWAFGVI